MTCRTKEPILPTSIRSILSILYPVACCLGIHFCAQAGGFFFIPATVLAFAVIQGYAYLLGFKGFLKEIADSAAGVLNCVRSKWP